MSADPFVPNPVDLNQPTQSSSVNPALASPPPNAYKPSGSLFKFKRGILIGLILLLILPISVYFVANNKTIFKQRAACTDSPTGYGVIVSTRKISNTPPNGNGTNGPWTDGTVWIEGDAYNCTSNPVTLYRYKFWCPVWTGRSTNTFNCSENGSSDTPITIPANTLDTAPVHFRVEQKVGNTGTCGSAQVDYQFTAAYDPNLSNNPGGTLQWGIFGASTQDCTAPLSCTSVTTTGTTTVTSTDKTKTFTATVAGGVAPYHVTWTSVLASGQTGYTTGTFSPATCDITAANGSCTTTWTAPTGEPVANHSWIISASITDSASGSLATQTSGACAKTLTTTVTQALSCSGITMSPTGTTVSAANEARTLTANITGGNTPYVVTWTKTGGTTTAGATNNVVTWNAPSTLPSVATTWTVTATVADTPPTGQTAGSATCNASLTYTPPNTYTYRTCENNACATKPCSPATTNCTATQSTCSSDSQCAQTYKHNVCDGNSCKSVDCNPKTTSCSTSSDCKSDTDCTVTQTHKECRNNACTSVTGSGSNSCSSDNDCKTVTTTPTPPPIPTSGSTDMTVLGIGAGTILTILGVMLAL